MDSCHEYFEWVDNNPLMEAKPFAFQGASWVESVPKMRAMTINGLCIFLGISMDTWRRWRDCEDKDFCAVIREVECIIREQKFTGAAADLLNPNIIARDLGLNDKPSSELVSFKFDEKLSSVENANNLIKLIASGVLPADIGATLISTLKDTLQIQESTELIQRLEAIEAALKGK